MQCHSTPDNAPKEVVATYGSTASFGWQPDQVIASLIVYVPTKLVKEHAFKALLAFMGLDAAMIDRAIVSEIIKSIKKTLRLPKKSAKEISKKNSRLQAMMRSRPLPVHSDG